MSKFFPVTKDVLKFTNEVQVNLLAGRIKIKSGQLVDINNDGNYSVFDYATRDNIRAYHGANTKGAIRKYRSAKATEQAFKDHQEGLITLEQFRTIQRTGQYKAPVVTSYRNPKGQHAIKVGGKMYRYTFHHTLDIIAQLDLPKVVRVGHQCVTPEDFEGHCIGWVDIDTIKCY